MPNQASQYDTFMIRLCRFFCCTTYQTTSIITTLYCHGPQMWPALLPFTTDYIKTNESFPNGPQVVVLVSCQGPVCPWVLACESPSCNNDQSLMESWALWLAGIASKIDVRWGVDWFDGWRWIGIGYEMYEIDMN